MKKTFRAAVALFCAAVIALSAATFTPVVGEVEFPFRDVLPDDWYYDEVAAAYEAGLMIGKTDVFFGPEDNITRAEAATVLSRIGGASPSDGYAQAAAAAFSDVSESAWYAPYIGWAAEEGVVVAGADGAVRPDEDLTRAELAWMMARFAEGRALDLPASETAEPFSDADRIGEAYAAAAETMRAAGIFLGDETGAFNPDSLTTRAEAAALFFRFSGSVKIAESTYLIASKYKNTKVAVISVDSDDRDRDYVASALTDAFGYTVRSFGDSMRRQKIEIVLHLTDRPCSEGIIDSLGVHDYRLRASIDGDGNVSLAIGYNKFYALIEAVDVLIGKYGDGGELRVPRDLDETAKVKFEMEDHMDLIINTGVSQLRDPFVLLEDGVYYLYGTGWRLYKNATGDLAGPWEGPFDVVETPADYKKQKWAPEVYSYGGAYYMFTTYQSKQTEKRGCAVFRADSPEGPFALWSDGIITPRDWDSIDGTLYIDPAGQPWMVFVHEWTSTDDGIGRMAAAKMDPELKSLISEPVELFRADDPEWSRAQITDGPFIYKCEDGSLLMIWSNDDMYGYCVAMAKSESGDVTGPWVQIEKRLYNLGLFGTRDGGHGMIFRALDGNLYLSFHGPNVATDDITSDPMFMRIREENGLLMPDVGE